MKTLIDTLFTAALVVGLSLGGQASAGIIGADDFSEADGTAVDGKAGDVGGNWSAPAGQTIESGILDTALVGDHQGSFLDFTQALGAGQVLEMTFTSAESAGTTFGAGGSYAGISLYQGGDEKLFIGDPGGGQPVDGWALDGFAGGTIDFSGLGSEAVSGVFTYNYDTGVGRLSVDDGTTAATAIHFYDPGLTLNRLRIQSGDGGRIAVDSFTVSVVPEPATVGLAALALAAALTVKVRKR